MENNYKNIITVKFAQAEQPKFEEKKGKGYVLLVKWLGL